MISVLSFLFLITLLVFAHEMGHYLVARWCGVKVSTFSVGFGPRLFGRRDKHGTDWRLSLIPLGGYVRFDDQAEAQANHENKHPVQKLLVALAGPAASVLFAIPLVAIGAFFYEAGPYHYDFLGAVQGGFVGTFNMTVMMFDSIVKLFIDLFGELFTFASGVAGGAPEAASAAGGGAGASGSSASEQVGSVLSIGKIAGDAASTGFASYMFLLGTFSIMLGILNMIPLLPLDGGHVVINFIAWLRGGKALPVWLFNIYAWVGLAFVLGLMILAITNDIMRFIV